MAKDVKVLRKKIKSFDSTLHLTGAMGLVASSKIRKATDAMLEGRKYLEAIVEIVDVLAKCPECRRCVYFGQKEVKAEPKTRLIVIAGDRGLCGGYNANVFRFVRDMGDSNIEVVPIGKRAFDRYNNLDVEVNEDEEVMDEEEKTFDSSEYYTYDTAMKVAMECVSDFASGKINRVGIVYNKYISIMTQVPDVKWILPLNRPEEGKVATGVFEPEPLELLNDIIPQYIAGILYALVKESFACEVAARRMAMDSAKKNATEMIENLQLEYNRVRQGKITQEITEIVAGAGK